MNIEYQKFGLDSGMTRLIGIITVLVLIVAGIFCAMFLGGLSNSEASIMADSSDEALFTTKNIKDFNVKFGYQQDPQVMVFERNNTGVGIKIPLENVVWKKTEDSIEASSGDYVFRYSIIKDGQGNSVGIKEDIILSKIPKQTNFEFPINLKNLRPQKIKDMWRFFDENNTEQFYIPKPFMIDAKGERSEAVEIEIINNKISVVPDKDWLNDPKRAYPVIVDPSLMITILNVHSHPQAGDNWTVFFEIIGTADLKIIPADQQSIDDLDFISLKCGDEERFPQILENDIIFYSDWSCEGTGEVIHLVNVAAPHILEFQFSDYVAFAYNSPSGGDISFQNLVLNNLKTEKHAEPPAEFCAGDAGDHNSTSTVSEDLVYCDNSDRLWTPTAIPGGSATAYTWGGSGTNEPTNSCIGIPSRPACNYCDSLTYAGYSDWELPSCVSGAKDSSCVLWTLYNTSGDCSTWDTNARASYYWSSTENDSLYAWGVYFDGDYVGSLNKGYNTYVRCVRG
ncbi:DUF1566 domain-containing protein [bacterium]|nr:MAG: DUF1566 domain-containing protein [bacterium]